jgi:hypothetical protein
MGDFQSEGRGFDPHRRHREERHRRDPPGSLSVVIANSSADTVAGALASFFNAYGGLSLPVLGLAILAAAPNLVRRPADDRTRG